MINLLLGLFGVSFGLATIAMRFVAPESGLLSKLAPMKARFGDTAGTALHVAAYTVLPLLGGGFFLSAWYFGWLDAPPSGSTGG